MFANFPAKCLQCHSIVVTTDAFVELAVPIDDARNLKDALHCYFEPEKLEGVNKYHCDICTINTDIEGVKVYSEYH